MEIAADKRNVFFTYSYPNHLLTSYIYPVQDVDQNIGGTVQPQTYKKHFGEVLQAIVKSYQNVKVRNAKVIKTKWKDTPVSAWIGEVTFEKSGKTMVSWAFLTQYDGWFVKHRISIPYTTEDDIDVARKTAMTYINSFAAANTQ